MDGGRQATGKSMLLNGDTTGSTMNGSVNPSHLANGHSTSSLSAFLGQPAAGGHHGTTEVDGPRLRRRQEAGDDGKSSFERFACDESGMHGMPIVGSSKNSWPRRIIWLALILSSFGLLTYLIQERVQKFLNYETATNVVLKYEPQLSFPAVTICNFNPFYQSLVNDTKDQAILSLLRSNLVDSSIRELGQATARTIPQAVFRPAAGGGGIPQVPGGVQQGANGLGGQAAARGKRQITPPAGVTNPAMATTIATQKATMPARPTTQQSAGATRRSTAKPATASAAQTQQQMAQGTSSKVQSTGGPGGGAASTPVVPAASPSLPGRQVTTQQSGGGGGGGGGVPTVPAVVPTAAPAVPSGGRTAAPGGGMGTGTGNGAGQGTGPGTGQTPTARDQLFAILGNETALLELLEPIDVGEYFKEKGVQIERMLISCVFRGVECNVSDFKHAFTTYGNCYTFNPDETRQVSQAGQGHGLEVTLNVESEEYIHGVDQSVGARILLHSKAEQPFTTVDSLGFAAAPGATTLVGISRRQVSNLDTPYNVKGCRGNEPSDGLKYFDNYTLSNCALECFADLSESICGCRAPYMPSNSNSSYCNPVQMFRCVDEVKTAIVQGTNKTFDCIENRQCVQPCEYQSYGYILSSALYPSENSVIQPGLSRFEQQQLLTFRRKNYVHLSMFYEELNYERVEQVIAYDWLSLVSEIGGLAGILLGASALTFLEFLDYTLGRLMWALTYCLCRSRHQRYSARRRGRLSFQGSVELENNWSMQGTTKGA